MRPMAATVGPNHQNLQCNNVLSLIALCRMMPSSIKPFTYVNAEHRREDDEKQVFLPCRLWCTPRFQVCMKEAGQAAAVPQFEQER